MTSTSTVSRLWIGNFRRLSESERVVATSASWEAIASLDQGFAGLFTKAMARGELKSVADAAALAKIATATIHTLAIRARLRAPKSELRALIDAGVAIICGPENKPKRSKREA